MRRTHTLLPGLAVLLALGGPLQAQSLSTGGVTGVVKDDRGKPLAGVLVRAASDQTVRTAVTDTQGRYHLNLLGLGKWTLSVQASGYQSANARATLGINDAQTINFKLAPVTGTIVTVIAETEQLQMDTAQVSTNFKSEIMDLLPTNSTSVYGIQSLVASIPGVQSKGSNDFQFNGGSGDQNLFVVDGNNTNSTRFNQSHTYVTGLPPREFLESVEVVTGGFGAEYNVLGGVINMATKSGGNAWSGNLFWYSNFPNSNAKQLWNLQAGRTEPAPFSSDKRFGFSVSGPILKDKLFLFAGVQGTKSEAPPSGVGGANWNGYMSDTRRSNGPNTLSLKLSWIVNSSHELILASTGVKHTFDQGDHYPQDSWMQTGSNNQGIHGYYENQTTNLTWNWVISPQLFLVTSVGNHTDPYHLLPNQPNAQGTWAPVYDYRYFIDGPGSAAQNKPPLSEYYAYVGGTGFLSTAETNPNKQVRVDVTWVASNHLVKAGYNLQQARFDASGNESFTYNINSEYSVYGTKDPADLELDYSGSYNQAQKATYASYYIKDLWEVTPGLRIDLGMRFDTIRFVGGNPPIDGHQLLNFSNFRRQMQPRLGIAWDVRRDGRTKLYANFGRFFETMPMQNFTWASSSEYNEYYWKAEHWRYNTTYGPGQDAFTILNDPATGKPYLPDRTKILGSQGQNPPMANDLRLPYKDVVLIGADQVLPGGWTVGGSWRWWKIGDPIATSYFSNPDGSDHFSNVTTGVVWNPRPGPVTFTAGDGQVLTWNSPFPDPKEVYIGLNLHSKYEGALGFVAVDYTWCHHYGNFRGLSMGATTFQANSNQWGGNANATTDWAFYQTIASGNIEANPVHEFKISAALDIPLLGQKLNIAPVFLWQSGYGLTAAIPASHFPGFNPSRWGYTEYAYNRQMSNMGRTPSFTNLDLNLSMAVKAGPLEVTPSLSLANVFNSRAVTGVITNLHASGGGIRPNEFFGKPFAWQSGRAVTAGVSVKF